MEKLHKNIIYVNDNKLYFKDVELYKFNIVSNNDELELSTSISEAKLRLAKYSTVKKSLDKIIDFKIETFKDTNQNIFMQEIKIKYNLDDITSIRKISFNFYKNKFILGV